MYPCKLAAHGFKGDYVGLLNPAVAYSDNTRGMRTMAVGEAKFPPRHEHIGGTSRKVGVPAVGKTISHSDLHTYPAPGTG